MEEIFAFAKIWRSKASWKQPLFPHWVKPELTNIIEFPFVQSHRSESFLRQKYLSECLSPVQIGELTFSSKRTVLAWLEQYKIPLRPEDVPIRRGLRFGEKRVLGRIVQHDGQVRTVRLMKELRKKGYSYPQIVDFLNSSGTKAMHGGKWYLKTVYEVLHIKNKVKSPSTKYLVD